MSNRIDKISPTLNHAMFDTNKIAMNEVHEQYLKLQQHFGSKSDASEGVFTPYEIALHHLVDLLHWSGDDRLLMEALPHLEAIKDIAALQAVLSNIGYETVRRKVSYLKNAENIFPCLLDFENGPVIVTMALGRGRFKGFDKDGACEFVWKQAMQARSLILIQSADRLLGDVEEKQGSWFYGALQKLRRPIMASLFLTCIANVLTLATPLYTMNVYNRVIGGRALDTLAYFFIGICLIIGFEVMIRRRRGSILSFIGARIDAEITNRVFKQILTLPVVMTETASVNRQIVQFRQFESIRDLITGNLASTLLDLPFLVLFFGVIGYLAGWLVVIPLILLAVFSVLASFTLPVSRKRGKKSGHDRTQYNRMSMELANKMQAVRELGVEDLWLARHTRVLQISAFSMFRSRFFETGLQTGSQILVMLAGLSTIALGAYQVIIGELDTGALIAVMMIVWRILTPLQVAFLSLNRIGQLKQTVQQLDRLMQMPRERRFKGRPNSLRKFEGDIKFENVSFRYGPKAEPVLKGINFSITHGELVALTGATGVGKSTILKMLLGLYKPQAGRIFLDGINIQQLDVGEVRSSIGFMPQEISVFYGSLAQNLLLANPLASRSDLQDALHNAGILLGEPILEGGLDRPLRHENGDLSENDVARIALARAYLVNGPVLLLDNPGAHFNNQSDRDFIARLQKIKGKKTVLLVTNRPSHIRACDRVLQLHGGALVSDVPVEEYIEAMNSQSAVR